MGRLFGINSLATKPTAPAAVAFGSAALFMASLGERELPSRVPCGSLREPWTGSSPLRRGASRPRSAERAAEPKTTGASESLLRRPGDAVRPAVLSFPSSDPASDSTLPLAGDEAPQIRVQEFGSAALAPSELLALVLSGGLPRPADLALARELMKGRSLDDLNEMGPSTLPSLGLAQAQVDTLRAAFEIARRLALNAMPEREPLSQPAQIVRYLALRFRDKSQEVLGAIYLDGRQRVIATEEIFRGGIARIYVEPAPILREALARYAASLILFHTHPSGDPKPSAEDIAFTRRLAEAGMNLGIELLDHLIVGSGRWCSLKMRGLF